MINGEIRQLQNYSLLRTFVHPITFKFYPSLIFHFKLSSESVSTEAMKSEWTIIATRERVVLQWTRKKSESCFFVSCIPDKPLHGIRIMDTAWVAWPSSASNNSVVWKLFCRCGMVVRVRGFLRGVLSGWDEVNFLRGVLSGWVEMKWWIIDDVEGSGQSLGDSGRNQRKDRSQRNNHRPVVIRIGKTAIGPLSEC